MNTGLIVITVLSSVAAVLTAAVLLFWFIRKRNLIEAEKEVMPIQKLTVAIDIKNKVFDIYEVDPEGELTSQKVAIKLDIPLYKLTETSDHYARSSFVIDLIKKIDSNISRDKVVQLIYDSIGKTDKIRHKRKEISFITIASYNKKESKVYLSWHSVNFNIEVFTELDGDFTLYTEQEAAQNIARVISNYKKPLLVKITPHNTYTHITDPTFPPDEIIRITNYYLNKKYDSFITNRYNIYAVIEVSGVAGDLMHHVTNLIEDEIKIPRFFSSNISNKFDALTYTLSLIKTNKVDTDIRSVMNSIIISKIKSDNSSEVFISDLDATNDKEFNIIYKSVNKKVKEAIQYSSNFKFNYIDDISPQNTVISTAIPNSVKYFINQYTVGIKEKYLEKIVADLEKVKVKDLKRPMLMVHWSFVYDMIIDGVKIDIPILTYRDKDDIDSMTFPFLSMLEKTKDSHLNVSLLMRNVTSFYQQAIEIGTFKSLIIPPPALTTIYKDISNELTLEYNKKLAQDKGMKVIEFK